MMLERMVSLNTHPRLGTGAIMIINSFEHAACTLGYVRRLYACERCCSKASLDETDKEMVMKVILSILFLCVVSLSGCSSIPENGAILNQKVSDGISKNQAETEKIIKALADVERAILDREWDSIYVKIETAYLTKYAIADAASLTQNQRKAIAANAAKTYYDLLDKIAVVETRLVSQTQANSETIIEINDEVTKFLLSTETLDQASNKVKGKLSEIVGIDVTSLPGLAKNLIGGI